MNAVLAVLGALGGAAVFVTAVVAVIRAIFKQISATEANTVALQQMSGQMGNANGRLDNHETRISRLEGTGR
jgi:hypothetical protein